MGRLTGKVALVTGGASGMGRAMVALFGAEDARVAALDVNAAALDELARWSAGGAPVLAVRADVTDRAALHEAVRRCVARFGRLDVLVNSAGISIHAPLAELAEADWDRVLAVNLKGPFLAMQAAVPALAESGGGSIVNIASVSARECYPGGGSYSASKAGLAMLTRQAAVEFAPLGVRVNAICPGFIRTPLTEERYQQPGVVEGRSTVVPVGRIGTAEDVARLALFLASDDSAYVSGESIAVDGGLLAASWQAGAELARLRGAG